MQVDNLSIFSTIDQCHVSIQHTCTDSEHQNDQIHFENEMLQLSGPCMQSHQTHNMVNLTMMTVSLPITSPKL